MTPTLLRSALSATAGLTLLCSGLAAQGEQPKPGQGQKAEPLAIQPFDQQAFEAHMRQKGVTEKRLTAFQKAVPEESAKYAVDSLLREVYPAYKKACDLAEDDDPRGALELTKVIEANKGPYVSAYARYQLARVFLGADDPEQSAFILAEFVEKDLSQTPLDSEVIYFYGNALAMIPERERAIRFFAAFLQQFPDAPERLRSSAAQIKAELEQQEGVLHDLSDVMKMCERKIRKTDTGKETQDKQKMVIDELEKIIKMLEQQENQSGGAPGGPGGIKPASESKLPGGEATVGKLNKVPPKVAAKWGNLKDKKRKEIEAELNEKLSPRYRKMIEDFYRKLGKGGR